MNMISLDEAIDEFHRLFAEAKKADQRGESCRVKAGKLLLDLRARIEAGEAGEVIWWKWFADHSVRSRRDAERVMKLARSDDPETSAETERETAREGMRRSREKATADRYFREQTERLKVAEEERLRLTVSRDEPTAEPTPPPPAQPEAERKAQPSLPPTTTAQPSPATPGPVPETPELDGSTTEISPELYRTSYVIRADQAAKFAFWQDEAPTPDAKMVEWAKYVAQRWTELAQRLEKQLGVEPDEDEFAFDRPFKSERLARFAAIAVGLTADDFEVVEGDPLTGRGGVFRVVLTADATEAEAA
jgi:hypothetical protein